MSTLPIMQTPQNEEKNPKRVHQRYSMRLVKEKGLG